MKTTRLLVLLIASLFCLCKSALAQEDNREAYAVIEYSGNTLTFYYDNNQSTRNGSTYSIPWNTDNPEEEPLWHNLNYRITKVVFDETFGDYLGLTSTANMFYDLYYLTTIEGISYLKTDNVTDMSHMFHGCRSLESLDVSSFNTSSVENMSYMFDGCQGLDEINLSNFITSSVKNMSFMFAYCMQLSELNLSSFNTARVTDMSDMFNGCDILGELDLSTFNTAQVSDMSGMFEDCINLTNLNVSNFNTQSVTDMSSMFNRCVKLNNLNLSSFNTESVTNMSSMFSGCEKLKKLDLSNFNPESVTNMAFMFGGCVLLDELKISNFNTESVTNMSHMFSGCAVLDKLDLSKFNTESVTDMSEMFHGCALLGELVLSNFNTENVEDMSHMFYGCASLTKLDLSKFSTSAGPNLISMFEGCTELQTVDIRNFSISEGGYTNKMFKGCSILEEIICLNTWSPSGNYYSQEMFSGCTNLKGGKGSVYNPSYINNQYAHPDGGPSNPGYFTEGKPYAILSDGTLTFYYDPDMNIRTGKSFDIPTDWTSSEYVSSITAVTFDESFLKYTEITSPKSLFTGLSSLTTINNLRNLPTANVTDMSYMFSGFSNLTSIDLTNFNTSRVTNMSHMFEGCCSLTSLVLSDLNTEKVTDISYMFAGCENLESLVLPNYNSSHLTNTSHMFDGCNSLTSIDVSKINTAYVTDMSYMFSGCRSLTSLDVSSFDVDNVTNMTEMFSGCSSLATIYCNNDWSDGNVSSSDNMFTGCPFVQDNNVTVDFAKPSADGGYFSVPPKAYAYLNNHQLIFRYDDNWFDLDNVFTVNEEDEEGSPEWWMFYREVTQVIFEQSFRVSRPTSTANWFASMRYLESITGLEYLNTKAVTDMNSMFYGCEKLTSLDLTSFDVSNVTNMSYMFAYCSRLDMIYAEDWSNIERNEDFSSSSMFEGCEDLPNWDENNSNDIDFAKPSENGGYFSTRQVYAIVEDDKLTFHYDGYNFQNIYTIDQNARGTWKNATFTTVTFDPSFADYKLTSTAGMFREMEGLTTIYDLDNLNTSSITDMSNMFYGCTNLKTIYCGKDWSGLRVPSTDMFAGCTSLIGAISYSDDNANDKTYAHPYDYGYFTKLPQAYAVQEGSVLTFYYDNRIDTHSDAITYEIPWFNYYPEWTGMGGDGYAPARKSAKAKTAYGPITRVVFNPSFAGYEELYYTTGMFYGMESLTSIEGLEYLNTENVAYMQEMFSRCSSLTSLDLTNFDVSSVESMSYMFSYCYNLATIFCNEDWSKKAVSLEEYGDECMFEDCYSLKGRYGANYEDFMNDDEAYISYAHPDASGNPGFFTDLSQNDILLYDSRSNTETISNNEGGPKNVYLIGRKLYKDGDWNTLCLPFNVNDADANDELTFSGTPLEGATVMTLSQNGTGFSDGELSLNFVTATTIEAGKPYIVKWGDPEDYDEYEETEVIINPTFTNVTIQNVQESQMKVETDYVDFVGNFNPFSIGAEGDKTKLYLGAGNGLYYPNGASTFYGFRAYFQLKGDLTAGEGEGASQIKAINLNFGDEENGIKEITTDSNLSNSSNTYFSLDGLRLLSQPATPGIYIHNGRKVLIK